MNYNLGELLRFKGFGPEDNGFYTRFFIIGKKYRINEILVRMQDDGTTAIQSVIIQCELGQSLNLSYLRLPISTIESYFETSAEKRKRVINNL